LANDRQKSFSQNKCLLSFFNCYFASFLIIAVKPTTGTTPPPNIEIDSLLISWGLISGHYENDDNIQTRQWSRFHQLFTIAFLWYILIRFIVSIFLDENSVLIAYIGDISIVFNQMMPRIFLQCIYFVELQNNNSG
jgi:hypothetical protein